MSPYGSSAAAPAAAGVGLAYTGINTLSMVLLGATLIMCGVMLRRIALRGRRRMEGRA